MDSENSGAIFRLKNIALVRSSPVVPQTKVIDSKLSSVKKKPVVSDQSAAINSIFDQIYRATPLPSATILQNSNYNTSFWDNGLQFASDMPNISPIYGISQSLSSSHSGGISYPSYEKSQQLHLHDMQSRQQNQYHSANFSAPTMIPPSNRLSRISDSSTSQIAQHQAGSQFQWQVELKDSPAENTAPDPKSAKDSRNNPQDNFSLEQDSAIDIYADESAVDIRDVDEDNCTASTGKLLIKISEEDATLTNTAVSNSSRSSSAISKISSSSSGSKSRADPSSSSSVFVDTLGDVSTRPKLRRKFVMDSLFSLNIKPSAEQQLLSGNESTGEKTAKDKIVKRMSVSETKNLSVGGSKGVSSKKLTITHEADNIDRIGCTRDSSEEDNIAHVKPVRGGVGLSYTANFPDSKNSTASKGTGSWVSQSLSQSKSIPPSQSPKKQQKKPLIHGSLILVPLARLYTSSAASSSDDDISESYRRMKRKARSAVKAKTDRKKASVRKDIVIDLDSETETGIGTETDSMPLETVRTKSEVRHSESASGLSLSHDAPKTSSKELPQVQLLQEKVLQTTVLYDSLSQKQVRPAAVRKVRESTRLKGSSSASEEDSSMGHQEPTSSPTLTRATRSSLSSHEGRKSTESESSLVGVRACVRSEGVISSAAHTIRTRRKPVETPCDETVIVSTDEWHKDEVLSLHSAQLQVDVTAPDFWVQVGAAMAERGYLRSPDACRDEWFKFSENGNKKKNRSKKKTETTAETETEIADTLPSSKSTRGTKEHSNLSTDDASAAAGQKRKRRTRAEIKRLAEESSEATRADDIFEFEKNQRSRVFVTIGVKSGLPSSSSTSSATAAAIAADFSKSIATPSRSSQRIGSPTGKETCIAELQSPHTTKVSEVSESHRSQISKKNIANYVHNLSKKTVSMHRDKMTAAAPVKAISKAMSTSKGSRGRPRKSSSSGLGSELVGGMSAAFNPRTGKVVVTATAAKQGSSEDSDDCISDEYNRNMSEEEDGDF